jgi:bacteriorhodopsin
MTGAPSGAEPHYPSRTPDYSWVRAALFYFLNFMSLVARYKGKFA